jgi:hypothetical protein
MQFPVIHLNGTSKAELLKGYTDALNALDAAMVALAAVTVHGRDYYVIGSDAASIAFEEHNARRQALQNVHAELEAIAINISDQ